MGPIPLRVRSQYSVLRGTASIPALVAKAKEYALPALALTDFYNLFGTVEFFKECGKEGIKPVIGIEIAVAPRSRLHKKRVPDHPPGYPLLLLARDKKGYRNLCKIASVASVEGFYYTPRVDRETLEAHAEGLICISGTPESRIGRMILRDEKEDLEAEIEWSRSTYGERFYFELQRHRMTADAIKKGGIDQESWIYGEYRRRIASEEKIMETLSDLSSSRGIPYIVSNDIRYLQRDDWKAHEILMNIGTGEPVETVRRDQYGREIGRTPNPKRKVTFTHEMYFKSPDQMATLFTDRKEGIENTEKIAEECNVELDFTTRYYPVFVPPGSEGKRLSEEERIRLAERFLIRLCKEKIPERYGAKQLSEVRKNYPDEDPSDVIAKRLETEFHIISSKGMCDYILIVYDFVAWAKSRDIPVGPGRGSGAGSLILYLIGITDIEPLRFNLFFERFINPERTSYPDIDVDICMERRPEVIEYTLNKYGRDKVAQIITFGRMKAKMAIRDVGRVLDVPLTKVNAIVGLIPDELDITIDKALTADPELQESASCDKEVGTVLAFARKLEGSIRNTGVHAAGIIISGDPLTDHIPVCLPKGADLIVTQYSMKSVEAVGMLKIDFLGLKTLTSIRKTVDAIATSSGKKIRIADLPLDDRATFDLLNRGHTQGIFQFESSGMQELIAQLHIDTFEEIIAVSALYRPGPMEMIPSFINRKHGKENIETDHPLMEEIIRETYGIIVYQEQVMQIARTLAGYSLGEGDILRRAMGKKDREEMLKQREAFISGAIRRSIDEKTATTIFDKIEKFASYGFNKSHATAYGFLSYVTAYLKANYPKEWLAALMTCDGSDMAKTTKHIRDASGTGIDILPPDLNESGSEFVATVKGIRFAMSGIKGVGRGVTEAIVRERERAGPFRSLYDVITRVKPSVITKKATEHLIKAGAFDFTKRKRAELLTAIEPVFREAKRRQRDRDKGIIDFLSLIGEEEKECATPPTASSFLSRDEMLRAEKELLGFYLTGHPTDAYKPLLSQLGPTPLRDTAKLVPNTVFKAACIIDGVKIKVSAKTQRKFAILTISDGADRAEVPAWSDIYEQHTDLLRENGLLLAILQVVAVRGEGTGKLRLLALEDLTLFDEGQVNRFNNMFEQIRQSASMRNARKEREGKNVKEKEKILTLKLIMQEIRFSHIVTLQRLLQTFPGSSPVSIDFEEEGERVGTIEIDGRRGVSEGEELKKSLRKLSFIHSFSFGA
ncbi:MAG: DNA polymerase III subunit alpha [Simkaniaceae bacterium]|nr:DNA polymerase III subunit alpha [Simkaniaceae bacterium]